MRHRHLLCAALLFAGTVQAAPLPEEIIEQLDGARLVAVLQTSDIDAAPPWQPAAGAPPVSIDAVTHSLTDYAARHPDLAGATLQAITLRPLPRHAGSWHYLARMDTHPAGHAKAHYFVVLMNGQVYPALQEPASVR